MDIPRGEKLGAFLKDNKEDIFSTLRKKFSTYLNGLPEGEKEKVLEDVYHESACALCEKIASNGFVLECKLSTYLTSICINQSLKFFKKHSRIVFINEDNLKTPLVNRISSKCVDDILKVESPYNMMELKNCVKVAFAEMASKCRKILEDYYIEGYSWIEIASRQNIKNADTAKSTASRCRKRFKEKYDEEKNRRQYDQYR